jgi:hypothetical protein
MTDGQRAIVDARIAKGVGSRLIAKEADVSLKAVQRRRIRLLRSNGFRYCVCCKRAIIPVSERLCAMCQTESSDDDSCDLAPEAAEASKRIRFEGFVYEPSGEVHPPWDEQTEQKRCAEAYRRKSVCVATVSVANLIADCPEIQWFVDGDEDDWLWMTRIVFP